MRTRREHFELLKRKRRPCYNWGRRPFCILKAQKRRKRPFYILEGMERPPFYVEKDLYRYVGRKPFSVAERGSQK